MMANNLRGEITLSEMKPGASTEIDFLHTVANVMGCAERSRARGKGNKGAVDAGIHA